MVSRILPISVPDGESASETYNLDIYGTLEPGVYRLVVETLGAEFLVGHGRMAGIEGGAGH